MIQKWLWACASNGYTSPLANTDPTRWSHDDNTAATQLGWMIAESPTTKTLDLYSLRQHVHPREVMQQIIALAPLDPLAARALTVLTAERMKRPNVRFTFLKD